LGQLVFNAVQFESARSGFADYARDGETAAPLRTRLIPEDLEQKVLALRALHAIGQTYHVREHRGDDQPTAREEPNAALWGRHD
jgi:hypothetical protein